MAASGVRVERLAGDIARVSTRGLPRRDYFAEVSARLRRVVAADALCWHTLDPQTSLLTSDAPDELISAGVFSSGTVLAAGQIIVASEYLVDDVNTFAGLARRRTPVGILSDATGGDPRRSARYRELLAPAGIPFELRAAFVIRGRAWGAVHIARTEGAREFTGEDAAVLAGVAPAIALGIRTSLRFDAARRPRDAAAPGLVVLGRLDDVELITPPARELIAALRSPPGAGSDDTPPESVLALAAHARVSARAPAPPPVVVAVPSAVGWITMHASMPEGPADGRVAIVLDRTATRAAANLLLETHGVTEREREIAALLAQGLSNPQIAERLVLSPYTVQDHIKNLLEKTLVATRQELVARVFLDDYFPHIAGGAVLTSSGRLVAADA